MLCPCSIGCRECRSGSWQIAATPATPFRQQIREMGATPGIPSQSNEAPIRCPDWIYANRNRVERLWARLKEWRAIATRYEKTATSFNESSALPQPSITSSDNRPKASPSRRQSSHRRARWACSSTILREEGRPHQPRASTVRASSRGHSPQPDYFAGLAGVIEPVVSCEAFAAAPLVFDCGTIIVSIMSKRMPSSACFRIAFAS